MSSNDVDKLKDLQTPDEFEALLRDLIDVIKERLKTNPRVAELYIKIYEKDIKDYRKKYKDRDDKARKA